MTHRTHPRRIKKNECDVVTHATTVRAEKSDICFKLGRMCLERIRIDLMDLQRVLMTALNLLRTLAVLLCDEYFILLCFFVSTLLAFHGTTLNEILQYNLQFHLLHGHQNDMMICHRSLPTVIAGCSWLVYDSVFGFYADTPRQ